VRDSAALLDATAGDYPQQLMKLPAAERPFLEDAAREPGRVRVAFSFDPGLGRSLHADNRAALTATTARLASLGHEVVEVRLPVQADSFVANYAALIGRHGAAAPARKVASRQGGDQRRRRARHVMLAKLGERNPGPT